LVAVPFPAVASSRQPDTSRLEVNSRPWYKAHENQSDLEPTMKRRSLFLATVISIFFLHVSASNAQETNALPDGVRYIGEMKDGKPNGRGMLTWPVGCKYVGEFRDGKENGHGTYTCPDGRKYVGEFKDDKPNGQETATYPDGRKYVGQFRDGKMDGSGKMTYPNGKVENGQWKADKFVGASTSS
jgi:hypothetical protein